MSIAGTILLIGVIVLVAFYFLAWIGGVRGNANLAIGATTGAFIGVIIVTITGAFMLINLVDAATTFFFAGM